MRLQKSAVLASVLLCLVSVSSNAVEFKDEYSKQIKSAEQVGALGPDMFGEETNFYTGTTEFRATDVSLPGNYSVPVSVGRRFTMDKMGQPLFNGAFGDWDLDIPHLQGIFAKNVWQSSKYNSPNSRCSVGANNAQPPTVSHQSISWSGTEYWSGNTLYVPGAGSQEMLSANATNNPTGPTDGKTYYWVTNNQWYFSCLSATANGVAGEAFLAVAPDGTTYKFDWVVKRDYAAITKTTQLPELMMAQSSQASVDGPGEIEPNVIANSYILPRQEFWIMPTEITDRHGNTVHYTYDSANPWRLKSIETDWGTHVGDGRKITLTYNAAGKVSTVSDGTRTWTYTYVTGGPMVTLSSVTLPDNSAWQIHLDDLDYAFVTTDPEPFSCENMGALYPSARTGTMTHPSGATGTFYFEAQRHGRSYVTKVCDTYDPAYSNFAVYPKWYDVIALKTKTISGPGMTTAQWAYTYGPANASFADECASGCPTTRTVEVSAPAGEYIRYTFGNKFLVNEGKLLKVERGSGPTGILTTEDTTYLLDPTGQIYPTLIGSSPYFKGDRTSEKLTPTTVRTITQQGATFTWQVPNSCLKGGSAAYCFDVYANPTKITRTSAGLAGGPVSTYTSTDLLTYENSTLKWVLGLSKTVTDAATSKVESEVVYDSTSLLPIEFYTFGVLQQKLTYEFAVADAYGVVKTVKDGLNNTTTVGNWYRGIPRLITYADATTQKATVNAIGRLLTTEDQNTYVTSYSYDALGRMTGITYPTGDTTAWNNTTRSFVPVASTEFGLGAGHWKQVVQTGNGKTTTYYDAQWRPRLILTEDTANAATKSYVVKRYDAAGREVFTSYPQGSLTTVDDTLKGVTTVYDAIGRATQSKQDSELILPGQAVPGQLVATTEYLTGFQIRTTNPRGKQTTTSYRAEDSPSTDAPVTVSLPMGVTTSITRDGFGKPLAVTRSGTYGGNAVTATRSYVYDTGERLCKTVNPESGAALVNYDAAGNIDWSADGTALTSLTCDRNAVVATAKTTRTYNSMNRVTAVTTPGNTANMAMTYKPDGLLATIAAANPSNKTVTTTYGYNKRRLPTDELSDNAGVQHSIFYYYDANAHLSSLKYPNGWEIAYTPDALGRATEVRVPGGQVFANAITYYPNGAISSFFYGNGVKHTMAQNTRQMPSRSLDIDLDPVTGKTILDDNYVFDENGNVDYITDAAQAGLTSRDLGYDDLDRLIVADSALQWGSATYAYDPLDNIRSADQGPRQYRYNYDAANRLNDIKNPAGATQFTFTYDAQGNTTSKGAQAYVFDSANRLSQVTGVQEYRYDGLGRRVQARDVVPDQTTYWIYSQAGQVLYSAEARRSQNIYYIYLGNTQVATRAVAWGSGTETIRYQHTDSLGSPVAETDPSRSVTERKSYAPYGEAYNSIIDGTGYAGHVMDQGTGLTYMQQRYYDPQIGRFLSEDPMDPDANTGASFDRYTYALNNPYRFLDPDGRQAKEGDQPKPESDGERRAREKAQRDRVLHSDGVPSAADFAASHPLPQGLVDASNGLGTGIINGASFGFADGEYFFDKAETPEYLALRDSGTVLGTGAGGGAFAKAGAAGGRQVLGKMVTSPTFGPAGTVFGRSRLGGSSLFNINANNTLRIGWGWKGAAQTGTHVFRIAGKVVEKIKQSGHIDLWP